MRERRRVSTGHQYLNRLYVGGASLGLYVLSPGRYLVTLSNRLMGQKHRARIPSTVVVHRVVRLIEAIADSIKGNWASKMDERESEGKYHELTLDCFRVYKISDWTIISRFLLGALFISIPPSLPLPLPLVFYPVDRFIMSILCFRECNLEELFYANFGYFIRFIFFSLHFWLNDYLRFLLIFIRFHLSWCFIPLIDLSWRILMEICDFENIN